MEDQIFETSDDYSLNQIKSFESWLDREIGTETELNESASEQPEYYLMVFDLTHGEVSKIRGFENYFRECEGLR